MGQKRGADRNQKCMRGKEVRMGAARGQLVTRERGGLPPDGFACFSEKAGVRGGCCSRPRS